MKSNFDYGSFNEYWNECEDVYAMEVAENAWDYQQSKIDDLQKRVDAAKYYMKNIFSGDAEVNQCHLGDMLDILDGKIVDEIEQAVKGD